MTETRKQETLSTETPQKNPEVPSSEPVLTMRRGNTTFLIGIHFNETKKETLDDKIRKMIRRDVENGNF